MVGFGLFEFKNQPVLVKRIILPIAWGCLFSTVLFCQEPGSNGAAPEAEAGSEAPPETRLYIREYRVTGAKKLPPPEIEKAVYPYLGPGRTEQDVEGARIALEKAYHGQGFQTVAVQIPPQEVRKGIVVLQVVEAPIGRLRVKGSRFFDIDQIKKGVPSLAEGNVPDFNQVAKEIVALNQMADRRVIPSLGVGVVPGTVDVELAVEDVFPLHGSIELNNRYSPNTTPLRLNASVSYNNLWQLGHTLGGSFQVAPQRIDDALIYSGFYIAPVPGVDWLKLMVQGTRQNSNVSTLGGSAVAGNGTIIGARFLISLPQGEGFFHSASFGVDYKNFEQDVFLAEGEPSGSPITYYPFSLSYNAAWVGKGYTTEMNASLIWSFRGAGSDTEEFDTRRFEADGAFLYIRGDIGHTRDLAFGTQFFAGIQGQATGQALVDSEQFAAGGLDTVRGYLEAIALGDNAAVGSVELRSPSIGGFLGINESRFFVFVDAAYLTINDPLPEQITYTQLAGIGGGYRISMFKFLHGSLDLGVPLITQEPSVAGEPLLTFRVWGDF